MQRPPPRTSLLPNTTLSRPDAEGAHLAGADLRQGARHRVEVEVDAARHHVGQRRGAGAVGHVHHLGAAEAARSEEHTSELQSRQYLVCRLLLEKKTYTRSPA